jgi:hypothetical protein
MLEEKNDNLSPENQETDGIQENKKVSLENQQESTTTTPEVEIINEVDEEILAEEIQNETEMAIEPTPVEETTEEEITEVIVNEVVEEPVAKVDTLHETEVKVEPTLVEESIVEDSTEVVNNEVVEETATEVILEEADQVTESVELHTSSEELVLPLVDTATNPNDKEKALSAIEASNAEESEDESLKDRHHLPEIDYSTMDMETLVNMLEEHTTAEKIMSVKDHVEEIKKEFLSQYHHFIEDKKEEFQNENPESKEEFEYHFPLKVKFDQLYKDFRTRVNTHFKSLQNNLKANLEKRESIVEEIKNLINPQENIKDTLKHFNELRDQWKAIGPIPRDKYNHVWNNYHFHVENFYDYLHLDREARDLDFKHNLELKLKIIERVKELVNDEDIVKAFRELQDLHKIWKEEIGPVDREHREAIWTEFSELTKQMHDKREQLNGSIRERENANLQKKEDLIATIKTLATEKANNHSQWQKLMVKVEAARKEFFDIGKVPAEVNENTWTAFKNAVRDFNRNKNNFYKDIKTEQNENLTKKMELVEKANSLKDAEDFEATTPIMKQIQEEWKAIGHVPRKFSDTIWSDFKAACNHYFDRLKSQKTELNSDELDAFNQKKEYLVSLREFQLTGDHKSDLDAIKAHIEAWKGFGKVPFTRRHIEGKFNRILDVLFQKLSLSKKDSEMLRFNNKLDQFAENDDSRKIENEKIFIIRKVEELKSEIFQLENNIQFFAHAKDDNPLVKEVRKNIDRHKEELTTWELKLRKLRAL